MTQSASKHPNQPLDEGQLLLSRLVDDDLAPEELELLLDRLNDDEPLRAQWASHHLISATLQGHHQAGHTYIGLAARIQAELQEEPTILAPQRRRPKPQMVRRMVGVAIAAGVTAVTLIGVSQYGVLEGTPSAQVQAVASAPSLARPLPQQRAVVVYYSSEPKSSTQAVAVQPLHDFPAAVNRGALDAYLVNHSEFAPSTGVQGVLPYARIVSQEVR